MVGKYDNSQDFPENPFELGHFVSLDNFKGRKKDINRISRQLSKVKNKGVPAHFFITENGWVDKISFVKYMSNKYDLTSVYLNVEDIKSLDKFIDRLVEILNNQFPELGDYGLIAKYDFSDVLIKISEELNKNNACAFIFIDNLNVWPDFPSWYKRLFDTLDVTNKRIPIVFCLVSYPENFNKFIDINSSFTRIFERIMLD